MRPNLVPRSQNPAAVPRPQLDLCRGPLRQLSRAYARNLLIGTELPRWVGNEGHPAVGERPLVREIVAEFAPATPGEERSFRADLEALVASAKEHLQRVDVKGGPFEGNLRALARAAALEATDLTIVQFLVTIMLTRGLEPLTDMLGPLSHGQAVDTVAVAVGLARGQVASSLDPGGRLVEAGLVTIAPLNATVECKFQLDGRLRDLLSAPGLTVRRIQDCFVPRASRPTLDPRDFAHVALQVERASRLLAAALSRRERGINLLLHGPTGTGKTELAGVLARQVRATLREAGTEGAGGFTPSPPERLGSLLLGQRLLPRSRALLLFDELEDLFEGGGRGRGRATTRMSKAWFNRLLETNPVPTIWITNDAAGIDPAFLRRFSMSIELDPLDASRRHRVLGRAGARRRGLTAEEQERVARRFAVSAAELSNAVRVARLVGGGRVEASAVEGLLDSGVRLLTGGPPPPPIARAPAYRVELVNATIDLGALADRLGAAEAIARGVTVCLHGPPGTGKSEYVRHLAERLGRPLVARRVSDIESKWVGEAEKNLSAAFAEAEREGAILLFDEADSFLRERSRATHRWEVTLTNEFLQRLEEARGLVACTTNLFGELDPAVLRRFALRIGFDYLRAEQAEAMFQAIFAPLLGDAAVAAVGAERMTACGPLAPGDFAVVERRARILGEQVTLEWLLGELALEARDRKGAAPSAVGFRVAAKEKLAEGGLG